MSNFAAAFARDDADNWFGEEVDVDDVETVEDLADVVREESDDGLVVALLEHEDWFGVVRVPPDGNAQVYVSDAAEAVRSPVGEILVTDFGDARPGEDTIAPPAPLGVAGLLHDFGLKAGDLEQLTGSGVKPADAVTEIAERIGAVDALEELR